MPRLCPTVVGCMLHLPSHHYYQNHQRYHHHLCSTKLLSTTTFAYRSASLPARAQSYTARGYMLVSPQSGGDGKMLLKPDVTKEIDPFRPVIVRHSSSCMVNVRND
jgi:hypothetical protein